MSSGFPWAMLDYSPGRSARQVVRKVVEHLDVDRPLFPDHNRMKDLVRSGEILEAVEKEIGSLET